MNCSVPKGLHKTQSRNELKVTTSMSAYFTKQEAEAMVGSRFTTVSALPSVPIGTHGEVVDCVMDKTRGWLVSVRWDLPPKRSELMAQLGDLSFNIPWNSEHPLAELSKCEV